jgi:hypothetical protein
MSVEFFQKLDKKDWVTLKNTDGSIYYGQILLVQVDSKENMENEEALSRPVSRSQAASQMGGR